MWFENCTDATWSLPSVSVLKTFPFSFFFSYLYLEVFYFLL